MQPDDRKSYATLRAELAARGWCLYTSNDHDTDQYFAVRWGGVRELADLAEVERFLRQVSGQPTEWVLRPAR